MKIWEAIVYALVGGITELIPVSFPAHSAILQNVFHMTSLTTGEGPYIRAGICLGIVLALYMVFHDETKESKVLLRKMRSRDRRRRRSHNEDRGSHLRLLLLAFFALIPMLLSFLFMGKAESNGSLIHITIFFALNGILLFICTRGPVGKREAEDVTLYDSLLVGVLRMVSVFPGLSSVGTSLCVGRIRGMSPGFNFRFTYLLTMCIQGISVVFFLFRGIFLGSLSMGTVLSFLIAAAVSAVTAFFALLYFRNVIMKDKLKMFVYYCFDAAAIAFIIAIING